MASDATTSILALTLEFLRKITDGFSYKRKLGQGGFGTVYKGILEDGTYIAVKKLNENSLMTRDKQFDNEVESLMEIQHDNIVKLVGFCHETRKEPALQNGRLVLADAIDCLLCYEFLSKGSLDNYIFGSSSVDWNTRLTIIKGICKGLHFLHKELARPIIHMDLKPENILLGENMIPKIADFGLARLFGEGQTRTITANIVGTIGYVAPEFAKGGEISTRSDMYSLGLLIIEITTGEKNNSFYTKDASAVNFINSVRKNWTNDPTSSKFSTFHEECQDQVKACIKIGLRCVEYDQGQRPSIEDVVSELNGLHSIERPSKEDVVNELNELRIG